MERIVGQIRASWPDTEIIIRGDAGFCREEIMAWCEDNGIAFVLGLAKNNRLRRSSLTARVEAHLQFLRSGEPSRVFCEFDYQTRNSWSRARRVVAKAEHLAKGANPRFVVTSLPGERADARALYEDLYCARGDRQKIGSKSNSWTCSPIAPAPSSCAPTRSGSTFPPSPTSCCAPCAVSLFKEPSWHVPSAAAFA